MKRKNLFLIFTILLTGLNSKAEISLDIKPGEIRSGCLKDTFYIGTNKLASLTYSRMKVVGIKTNGPGLCVAAKQYIQSLEATKGTVVSKLENVNYLVKIFPCHHGMSLCKAIYRKSVVETVLVRIGQMTLYNKAEVPGSRVERVEEWDPTYCPPYAPDCDL